MLTSVARAVVEETVDATMVAGAVVDATVVDATVVDRTRSSRASPDFTGPW